MMIPTWLKKYLEALTTKKKLGLCQACSSVSNSRSGSSFTRQASPADRFTLQIPYASEIIEWELLFNHNEPNFPPDFIFDCHNFEPDFDNLEHLTNWDPRNPLALTYVIDDLYIEYKSYQVSLLSLYPRLQTIYNNVIQVMDDKQIEVYFPPFDKKTQHQQTVVFLISIEGPFDKIPARRFSDIQGDDLVLLKLQYSSPETSSKATDTVCVSPRLNKAFGEGLQLPALCGNNVSQYVTELKDFLAEKIDTLDSGLSKRKAYIDAFMLEFARGVLEADVNEYQTASAMVNYLDFHFILQVTMPTYFPEEQPKLTFRSAYHTDLSDKPFSKSTRTYPWSPRWRPREMMTRLQSFVAEIVPNFQKLSVVEGSGLKHAPPPQEYDETQNQL